jgi:hypothetical protein
MNDKYNKSDSKNLTSLKLAYLISKKQPIYSEDRINQANKNKSQIPESAISNISLRSVLNFNFVKRNELSTTIDKASTVTDSAHINGSKSRNKINLKNNPLHFTKNSTNSQLGQPEATKKPIPEIFPSRRISFSNTTTTKERRILKLFSTNFNLNDNLAARNLKEYEHLKKNEPIKKIDGLVNLNNLVLSLPYEKIPKKVKFSNISNSENQLKTLQFVEGYSIDKNGNYFKNVNQGSSTIFKRKTVSQDNIFKKLLIYKEDESTLSFKKSIKWKNLKWLLNHKSIYTDLLINNFIEIKWMLESRKGKVGKSVFDKLMMLINKQGVKKDEEFTNYIFLIFDENRDGLIDFNEMLAGLIFFKNDLLKNKMSTLTEICRDMKNPTLVSVEEFVRIVKFYIFNRKDIKKLTDIFRKELRGDRVIKFPQFYKLISNHEELKYIFLRSMENVNELENCLEEEITSICRTNLKRSKYTAFIN